MEEGDYGEKEREERRGKARREKEKEWFYIRRRLSFRRGMCSGPATFASFWAVAAVGLH
jgi:hypothetical protein